MRTSRLIIVSLFIALFSISAFSQIRYVGKVVEIVDAKTMVIELQTKNRLTIALQYVEVPEPGQELRQVAQDHLRDLVMGKQVEIRANGITPDTSVGQIFLGNVDVSEQMIRDGAAWYALPEKDHQKADESARYIATERQAKLENRGVWSNLTMKPAWVFRAEKEAAEQATREKAALDSLLTSNAKSRPVFGQPRYEPGSEFSGSAGDLWSGLGDTFGVETRNAAGLIPRYLPSVNASALLTPVFKLPGADKLSPIQYRAFYIYQGQTMKLGEGNYFLGFVSQSENSRFAQSSNLSIVIDGHLLTIGKAHRATFKNVSWVKELVYFVVARSLLGKMSEAKKVEFRVGKYAGPMEKPAQWSLGTLLEYTK